ncbi:MAG: DUF5684 domain-containing protein [Crocinitomicaceae bacterium]
MYSQRGLIDTNPALAWTLIIVFIAIIVLMIVSTWKVFEKAGKPGWAAIVPIYSTIVMVQVSKKPMWWAAILLLGGIIPVVGPIAALVGGVIINMAIAKAFGKSEGFGVGMALLGLIFWPMLAFSDATYEGEAAAESDDLLDA